MNDKYFNCDHRLGKILLTTKPVLNFSFACIGFASQIVYCLAFFGQTKYNLPLPGQLSGKFSQNSTQHMTSKMENNSSFHKSMFIKSKEFLKQNDDNK